MMLVIPFAITIVFTLINAFVFHHHISYNIFGIYYNYGLLSLSIVWMILNYLIQLKRIIQRENKGGLYEIRKYYKTYGDNNVLDNINFDFGNSKIVGLIGKMVLVKQH